MGRHCNSYGFSGGFAALLSAASWYLVTNNQCKFNLNTIITRNNEYFNLDNLKICLYVSIIVGIVLFTLGFFDFAGILYELAPLFYVVVLGIFASSGGMFFSTYLAFFMPCKSTFNSPIDVSLSKNVFEAEDPVGITVTTLNLISGLLLFTAAISFARRG